MTTALPQHSLWTQVESYLNTRCGHDGVGTIQQKAVPSRGKMVVTGMVGNTIVYVSPVVVHHCVVDGTTRTCKWDCARSIFQSQSIGTVSRAALKRLLRNWAERVWASPRSTMPSIERTGNYNKEWLYTHQSRASGFSVKPLDTWQFRSGLKEHV